MSKVVLVLWVMLADGSMVEPKEYTGWDDMDHCVEAADMFVNEMPKLLEIDQSSHAIIASCEYRK